MSSVRAIQRNKARKIVGNNRNISKYWKRLMIKKKGVIAYMIEFNRTTGSHKGITDIYYS